MPDFWAHRICASLTLSKLAGSETAEIIKRNQGSYRLGSQGADLLYFRPVQLLLGSRGVVYLAKSLHQQPVARLAMLSLSYLMDCGSGRQFESIFAYTCGFLCHHAVDQQVHPLIEQHTSSVLRHHKIELDLDAYLARELKRSPALTIRPWAGMYISEFTGLSEWYNHMFNGLYDRTLKVSAYRKAYKTMRRASGFINKPKRLQKPRYNEKSALGEPELHLLMERAIEGSGDAARLIEQLYARLAPQTCEIPLQFPLMSESTVLLM
jgi:hypothetical protein